MVSETQSVKKNLLPMTDYTNIIKSICLKKKGFTW